MIKYLGFVDQNLKPKNRLEKFLQNYIVNTYDRVLIDGVYIEEVKKIILKRAAGINLDHAKCTPVEFYWWTNTPPMIDVEIQDWFLGGCDCIRFSFRCGKESE